MEKKIMHFNSQKERLDYLRGGFEEIVPVEVEEKPMAEATEEQKPKKAKKGKKKDGKVQAE